MAKDEISGCDVKTLTLAREDAVVVGKVERQECQEVARVGDGLDTQGRRIEAKSGNQRALVELQKKA